MSQKIAHDSKHGFPAREAVSASDPERAGHGGTEMLEGRHGALTIDGRGTLLRHLSALPIGHSVTALSHTGLSLLITSSNELEHRQSGD